MTKRIDRLFQKVMPLTATHLEREIVRLNREKQTLLTEQLRNEYTVQMDCIESNQLNFQEKKLVVRNLIQAMQQQGDQVKSFGALGFVRNMSKASGQATHLPR